MASWPAATTGQTVEVRFAPHPQGTEVTLTHAGWETLGRRAASMRDEYLGGWQAMLRDRFAGHAARPVATDT